MYNIVKRYPTQEMDTNLSYTLSLTMPANLLDTNAKKDNLTKNRISLTNHERGSQYNLGRSQNRWNRFLHNEEYYLWILVFSSGKRNSVELKQPNIV